MMRAGERKMLIDVYDLIESLKMHIRTTRREMETTNDIDNQLELVDYIKACFIAMKIIQAEIEKQGKTLPEDVLEWTLQEIKS